MKVCLVARVLCCATCLMSSCRPTDGAKIGLLCNTDPNNWQYLFATAGAINIAIDKLVEEEIIQNGTIEQVEWRDTVTEADGLGHLVDLIMKDDVDLIMGSPNSYITETMGHLTSQWNYPHITWRGNSYKLSDKKIYTTMVRTIGALSELGDAMVSLFKKYKWKRIGMIYRDWSGCQFSAIGIKNRFAENDLIIMQSVAYPLETAFTDALMDEYLLLVKQSSRIIFLCAYDDLQRAFMIRACALGMCNGEFLFITARTRPSPSYLWKMDDQYDELVKQAYRYLIIVTSANWKDDVGMKKLMDFQVDVIERTAKAPWFNDYAKRNNMTGLSGSENLYEAIYLYGLWLNYSAETGTDIRDGRAFFEFSKNKTFEGIALPCEMSSNADRILPFWFQEFLGDDARAEIVAISEYKNKIITETVGFEWFTKDGLPPVDIPECGFVNELCPVLPQHDDTDVIIISTLASTVMIGCIGLVAGFIRKRRMENIMLQSVWKVNMNDIELQKRKAVFGSKISGRSHVTTTSSITAGATYGLSHTVSVGIFKGQTVTFRNVNKTGVLTKGDMFELKNMRELVHDNVNPFLGASFDATPPCFLFMHCGKGSLQDVLENDDIKLDSNFKYALAMDLVQGMSYIHNSKLGAHGRLKSSNCLVGNRWMVKITDYGLQRFMENTETNQMEEQQKCKSLLWTAPELLLAANGTVNVSEHMKGTKEGDVYSFAIIIHEIFYRMGTFAGKTDMNSKEIIEEVKRRRNSQPCRPAIFTEQCDVIEAVIKLMNLCWSDDPSDRPTFPNIRQYIKKNIYHGEPMNIVDVILQRLEKYATNLEELVDQRTHELVQEKQKSDKLLYRMLPKVCADKLKSGEFVLPEIYESATIFFSDIVGFTQISSRSTPMEVVDLLNDLYNCLDDIINGYDAYKVETIGDAYLIVSGIPSRNGDKHAGIIADMSLDIVQSVSHFRIRHLQDEYIKIRVGNHTGSCCAGIVGKSMPRYCLFGDTVNTASRMESNGEAQRVHLSEATHFALQKLEVYATEFRAQMEIKGKGLMNTYWLLGRKESTDVNILDDQTSAA